MKKNIYLTILAFIVSAGMMNAQNLPSKALRQDTKTGRNVDGMVKNNPLANPNALKSTVSHNGKGLSKGVKPMGNILLQEDFSAGMPSGFTLIDGDGGTPAGQVSFITDAWIGYTDVLDSTNMCAISTSYYSPTTGADDWMITSPVSIPAGTKYQLTWNAVAPDPAYPDGYEVLISTTGTNPSDFTTVLYSTQAEVSTWTNRTADLSAYAGQTVYIAFHNNSYDMFLLMVDDITVEELPSTDAGINFVYAPIGGCNLSATEQVRARIKNYGANPISGFQVGYSINGSAVTENVTSTINSGDTMTYTFNTPADLSAAGPYNVSVYTLVAGDADMTNDSVSYSINNSTPFDLSSPYTMGFEPGEDLNNWLLEDVNKDTKTWGLSSTRGNAGPYAATYNYNIDGLTAADDYLFSPCFDLKANNTYQIDFYYKVGTGYTEDLALMIGNAPNSAAMTQTIVDMPGLVNSTYELSTNQFTVSTSGIYFFGWHVYSAADQWYVAIDDINVSIATKVNEKNDAIRFGISPNPSSTGKFTLSSTSKEAKTSVKVANAMGQVVFFSTNLVNGEIDLSAQPKGVYFAELNTAGSIVNKKIVITK